MSIAFYWQNRLVGEWEMVFEQKFQYNSNKTNKKQESAAQWADSCFVISAIDTVYY